MLYLRRFLYVGLIMVVLNRDSLLAVHEHRHYCNCLFILLNSSCRGASAVVKWEWEFRFFQ